MPKKIRPHSSNENANMQNSIEEKNMDCVCLERRIGYVGGVAVIMSSIIGSGIFVAPKGMVLGLGSVGLTLIGWVFCGIISMTGAMCYIELGLVVPKSGGNYAFYFAAFGPFMAFFYWWSFIFIRQTMSRAIGCLICAEYLLKIFPSDWDCFSASSDKTYEKQLIATVVLWLAVVLNSRQVSHASVINMILVTGKIVPLILIVVGGIFHAKSTTLANAFEGTTTEISGIVTGLYSGLFAYAGWENLCIIMDELKNPVRIYPRAMVTAICFITALYVLVNMSYFTVLDKSQLVSAVTVAKTWAQHSYPQFEWTAPLAVVCSTFGLLVAGFLTTARSYYAAAVQGQLPVVLSMLHVRWHIPFVSLIFNAVVVNINIFNGSIVELINAAGFLQWMFVFGSVVALFRLRHKYPYSEMPRPFKVSTPVAVIFMLISAAMFMIPLLINPRKEYLYSIVAILIGVPYYIIFIHYKWRLPLADRFTKWIQILCEVA